MKSWLPRRKQTSNPAEACPPTPNSNLSDLWETVTRPRTLPPDASCDAPNRYPPVAVAGRAGSGKTVLLALLAEEHARRGGRTCIIDAWGVEWGSWESEWRGEERNNELYTTVNIDSPSGPATPRNPNAPITVINMPDFTRLCEHDPLLGQYHAVNAAVNLLPENPDVPNFLIVDNAGWGNERTLYPEEEELTNLTIATITERCDKAGTIPLLVGERPESFPDTVMEDVERSFIATTMGGGTESVSRTLHELGVPDTADNGFVVRALELGDYLVARGDQPPVQYWLRAYRENLTWIAYQYSPLTAKTPLTLSPT